MNKLVDPESCTKSRPRLMHDHSPTLKPSGSSFHAPPTSLVNVSRRAPGEFVRDVIASIPSSTWCNVGKVNWRLSHQAGPCAFDRWSLICIEMAKDRRVWPAIVRDAMGSSRFRSGWSPLLWQFTHSSFGQSRPSLCFMIDLDGTCISRWKALADVATSPKTNAKIGALWFQNMLLYVGHCNKFTKYVTGRSSSISKQSSHPRSFVHVFEPGLPDKVSMSACSIVFR